MLPGANHIEIGNDYLKDLETGRKVKLPGLSRKDKYYEKGTTLDELPPGATVQHTMGKYGERWGAFDAQNRLWEKQPVGRWKYTRDKRKLHWLPFIEE